MPGRRVKIRFPTEPVTIVFRDLNHQMELEVEFECAVEDVKRFIETWMYGKLVVWNVSAKSYTRENRANIEKVKNQQLEYAGYGTNGNTTSKSPARRAGGQENPNRRPARGGAVRTHRSRRGVQR